MKRIVILFLLLPLLLISCSITVDKAAPLDEQQESENATEDVTPKEDASNKDANGLKKLMELLFPDNEENMTPKPLKLLSLGDSLTAGVGDEYKQQGYVGRMAQSLEQWSTISKVDIDNRGKRGRKSNKLLELVEQGHYDKEIEEANLITVTMGGNDIMKVVKDDLFSLKRKEFNKERKAFTKRYATIVANIREKNPDVPLVLIGFYNPLSIVVEERNEFDIIISEWNAVIEKIANETPNTCYVDIADLFDSNDDMVYHTDFFHPNASGYDKIAARIMDTIASSNLDEQIKKELGFEE